ncbi:MAG: PEGA domain-containing protein [Candidatus Saccharimonadales bacterium]
METIDFMDFKQRRRHGNMLILGYALIGLVVLALASIFVFIAYGFNYKDGKVVQSGMVYLSSQPNPAKIYVDGVLNSNTTNTRLLLQAGTYTFKLQRTGYRVWQRKIVIPGGQIVYYQYPFLVPNTLTTSTVKDYTSAPALISQSPSQQYLLVAAPGSLSSFDLYNLNNPTQPSTDINLPDGLLSTATSSQSLKVIQWANDNSHLLLEHIYDGNTEYILMDTTDPTQSVNLTKTLGLSITGSQSLLLSNNQYNQYFVLDATDQTLSQATLGTPALQPYVTKVLSYKSYGSNTVLYATPDPTNSAEVDIDLYNGSNTYVIRHDSANTTYLLNLTTYDGNLYVAVAAASENREYVYENPVSEITDKQIGVAVPIEAFATVAPNYLSFSSNAQYVLFENGVNFSIYDIENQLGYTYTSADPLDAPQTNASWLDGGNLIYASKGQLLTFDFDGGNRQELVSADPRYSPYFGPNYKYLYDLVPSASDPTQELLTSTPLLTPADI